MYSYNPIVLLGELPFSMAKFPLVGVQVNVTMQSTYGTMSSRYTVLTLLNYHLSIVLLHLRKIKESCYIRHNPSLNRDRGSDISQAWNNLIHRTGCYEIPT
uniref:Uncharacterized protein n=1 Tax=Trichuris muris TaxID=70415 RepID=A0A5S6QGS2_TRIMR